MSKRRIGDFKPSFISSDSGLKSRKPERRSKTERQYSVQCEFCGRGYVGLRDHWRCPWCGIRNAPEDHRPKEMTCEEHTAKRKLTREEWALRVESQIDISLLKDMRS